MTQTPPNPSAPPGPSNPSLAPSLLSQTASAPPAAADDDALSHLYKMSRTAGLGSQDYVAINPIAVAAIILGIASVLVVVSPLLLVVPLAGIVLGIVAIRQIRSSSGTQTGGLMAAIALLLSIGFMGYKVVGSAVQEYRVAEDKKQISALVDGFGRDVAISSPESLSDAYSRFDSRFTGRVPRERFDYIWNAIRSSPYYGPIKSVRSNGQLKFERDVSTSETTALGVAIAEFEKGDAPRWTVSFRQTDGKWLIENLADLFPVAPPPAVQPGAAPR